MAASERKRSIIVGLFTFIGLIILIAGILVLGTQQNKFSKNLTVTTYFKDVKGLKVGNNVWFSGVKVGIIKEISFQSVENVKVVMNVEEKSSKFIRKDVIATLSSDGLIGNAIISLVGGSENVPAIENNDEIKSGVSGGMDAMLATLQVNNENLVEITKNFAALSQNLVEGKGAVGAMMTDETIAANLKQSITTLNGTMGQANQAVNNLVVLTKKLNNNSGLIHELSTDTAVFASLRESAAQLQGVTQTANALMANLNQTTARLNDKDNAIGVLTNDPEAANEIKQILRNLNTSTEKLDENMEALQSNFLLRGFFKKKAKEEAAAQDTTK
ncbi:MlaD family protein [Sphingobacterium lactis]|uniref:Phospholipid/cholesterol/gamma-HCH transport system substrate-binding protein n=1 Tax=Sphingobacterium lactis TaxID=797291 RepID=A0A1H5WT61_9SPHI|nr:MlaD family protein [Sphingobacterium lactis]SEG02147.1 phospholipid/cholesterol/gamma-HCH transport system substrate-binding protein [Sphingobacterium lactis]